MLSPISHHHTDAHDKQWQDECEHCRASVYICEVEDQAQTRDFLDECLDCQLVLLVLVEVMWKLNPAEEEEAEEILQELSHLVALIIDCGRQIGRAVALYVVHLNMMVVVRVPSMTHQWACNVWEEFIHQGVRLAKNAIVVDMVVKHQCKWASVPNSKDGMCDGMNPMEVVEKIYRARKQNREVYGYVSDKHCVWILSYEALRKIEVWLRNIFVDERMEFLLLPHGEDPALMAVLLEERLYIVIVVFVFLPLLMLSLARVSNIVPYIVVQISKDCLISLSQVGCAGTERHN